MNTLQITDGQDTKSIYTLIKYPGKKTNWLHRFKTTEEREAFKKAKTAEWEEKELAKKKDKELRKVLLAEAQKKAAQEVQIGDMYYTSWGYDQTNIGYYKVIDKKGMMFVLEEMKNAVYIENKKEAWEYMQNAVVPSEISTGRTYKRRIMGGSFYNGKVFYQPYFKISSSEYARKWDGRPRVETYTC